MQKSFGKVTLNNIPFTNCCNFLNKHINFKMGVLSGFVTGSIVFAINIEHSFLPALASFGKQFIFNLLMAGFNTRSCEKLAKSINNNKLGIVLGSVIPTLQAFLILYAIHYFGATPKPMASTLWQVPFNLLIFLAFTLVYRQIIKLKKPSFNIVANIFRVKAILPVKKLNQNIKNRRQAG